MSEFDQILAIGGGGHHEACLRDLGDLHYYNVGRGEELQREELFNKMPPELVAIILKRYFQKMVEMKNCSC